MFYTLYGAAGIVVLAFIAIRSQRPSAGDGMLATMVGNLFDVLKKVWGPFITYLIITTCVLAVVVGGIVIWPLALFMETAIIARGKDKTDAVKTETAHERRARLREQLDILMNQRQLMDDAIAEHQKELATDIATAEPAASTEERS